MSNKVHILTEYLVIKIQGGDMSSISELFKLWNHKLLKDARYYLRDNEVAKDVVQDAWIVIMRQLSSLKDPSLFISWSKRIVYFKSMDHHRKRKMTTYTLLDLPEDQSDVADSYKNIHRILAELNEDEKLLIEWHYKEDLMLSQIAEILNVPLGTVKSRLFTLRNKIKGKLKNQYYENE